MLRVWDGWTEILEEEGIMVKKSLFLIFVFALIVSFPVMASADPGYFLKDSFADERWDQITGIAIDTRQEYIYWADVDPSNNCVYQYDLGFNFVRQWGKLGDGPGEFDDPQGVAVWENTGNVYVLDHENHRVQMFNSKGEYIKSWGNEGDGDGEFINPLYIAVDQKYGMVYVADQNLCRIQRFTSGGGYAGQWGQKAAPGAPYSPGTFKQIMGLAVGKTGVYVSDFKDYMVQKFDFEGNFELDWGGKGVNPGKFNDPPLEMAVARFNDFGDYVFVTEWNRIQVFDGEGNYVAPFYADSYLDARFPLSIEIGPEHCAYVGVFRGLMPGAPPPYMDIFEPVDMPWM